RRSRGDRGAARRSGARRSDGGHHVAGWDLAAGSALDGGRGRRVRHPGRPRAARRPGAAGVHLSRQELVAGLHAVPEALLSAARRPGAAAALGLQPSVARLVDGSRLLRRASGGRCACRHRLPPGAAVASVELARGQAERRRLLALRLPRHGGLPAARLAPRPHRARHETRQGAAELLRPLPRALSSVQRRTRALQGRSGGPWTRWALPLLVVCFAAATSSSILGNFFVLDDFGDLFELANFGPREWVVAPAAGHLELVRNPIYYLYFLTFRMNPLGYFAGVWLTHSITVLLLFAVIRRCTESDRLAAFGAVLFALSGANAGTLGWYALYGHILATAF